jgi:hypothetical protein
MLLSKHYGIFWKTVNNLSFYRDLLEKWYNETTGNQGTDEEVEAHDCCEPQPEASD